jgi:hypothetical protein
MRPKDRRNGDRKPTDMPIFKLVGGASVSCRIDDLSPTGVRLARGGEPSPDDDRLCNLELHLVPNRITTVLTGRRVWRDAAHEAFEFVCPSFAQQAVLERLLDNY